MEGYRRQPRGESQGQRCRDRSHETIWWSHCSTKRWLNGLEQNRSIVRGARRLPRGRWRQDATAEIREGGSAEGFLSKGERVPHPGVEGAHSAEEVEHVGCINTLGIHGVLEQGVLRVRQLTRWRLKSYTRNSVAVGRLQTLIFSHMHDWK